MTKPIRRALLAELVGTGTLVTAIVMLDADAARRWCPGFARHQRRDDQADSSVRLIELMQ
jgi:hypothetical protein